MRPSTIILTFCLLAPISAATLGSADLDLPARRTTTDDSAISVLRQHIMIDLAEGTLHVSEVVMATNSGEKTIVANDAARGTFRISLPAGATDVKLSGDFDETNSSVAGNAAILAKEFTPGARQFVVQYVLRCNVPNVTFTRRLDYDTAATDFIFPDVPGTDVTSKDFEDERVVQMGQRPYRYLGATARKAGSTLTVGLSLPIAPANAFRWPALALVALAAIGFASFAGPLTRGPIVKPQA